MRYPASLASVREAGYLVRVRVSIRVRVRVRARVRVRVRVRFRVRAPPHDLPLMVALRDARRVPG